MLERGKTVDQRILSEIAEAGYLSPSVVFVDGTHISIDAFDDMVTGGAQRHQGLVEISGRSQCPHRGEPQGNLISGDGVDCAAALPLGQFRKLNPQRLHGFSAPVIQVLGAGLERTAREIGHHRTIVSAAFAQSFAPSVQL